jgi:hypothetical protein
LRFKRLPRYVASTFVIPCPVHELDASIVYTKAFIENLRCFLRLRSSGFVNV